MIHRIGNIFASSGIKNPLSRFVDIAKRNVLGCVSGLIDNMTVAEADDT